MRGEKKHSWCRTDKWDWKLLFSNTNSESCTSSKYNLFYLYLLHLHWAFWIRSKSLTRGLNQQNLFNQPHQTHPTPKIKMPQQVFLILILSLRSRSSRSVMFHPRSSSDVQRRKQNWKMCLAVVEVYTKARWLFIQHPFGISSAWCMLEIFFDNILTQCFCRF